VNQSGEPLLSVAGRFHISVWDLLAANPDVYDSGMGLDMGTALVIPLGNTGGED